MVVSASVASVRMRREFGDIETASCLLLCATCMHRVHHVQCGAAGANGLSIDQLTASAARQSAAAPKGCRACHEVLCQLLPASPIAAVVSTDIDENGRVCVGGLGPDAA